MPKYRLYSYDLWGNDEEGYTINDYYGQCEYEVVDIDNDNDLMEMIEFTKSENVIIDNAISDEHIVYFVTKDLHKPICELRLIEG